MTKIVISSGAIILISAFSYSAVTTLGRTDIITQNETYIETVRETMPMAAEIEMGTLVFADGEYTTSVLYAIPYGYVEPMEVTLTLKEGIVTDAVVAFDVVNPVSTDYQNIFLGAYKEEVVGQLVEEVSLSRMGGASLTNNAFDVAVERIKSEAVGQKVEAYDVVVE
jgi:hypothetical protein